MADYRRTEVISGLFIMVAIAVFGAFAFKVGDFALFSSERAVFVSWLGDSRLLKVGARVRMAGLVVGQVTDISLGIPPEGTLLSRRSNAVPGRPAVRVTYTIELERVRPLGRDGSLAFLPAESEVVVAQESLLGEWQVEVVPRIVAEGGVRLFPFAEGRDPIALPGRLGGLDQEVADLKDQLQPVIASVAETMRKIDEEILADENLRHFNSILQNADDLTGRMRTTMLQVERMLDPLNPRGLDQTLMAPAADMIGQLNELTLSIRTTHLPEVMNQVRDLMGDVKETTNAFTETAETASSAIKTLEADASKTLATVDGLLGEVEGTMGRLEAEVQKSLARVDSMLAKADPQVAASLSSLRRSLWQTELLLRKVRADPSVVLFGDDEEIFDVSPTDATGVRGRGRFGPYIQRQEGQSDGGR